MRQLLPVTESTTAPDLDALYAYPAEHPWLRVNMIASADGSAVLDGGSRALGTSADRHLIGMLRGLADVVVVGAATARAETYGPLRPRAERREHRRRAGLAPAPRLAIVSGSLDLDLGGPAFVDADPPTLVITHETADPARRAATAEVAELVVAGTDQVGGDALADALFARGLNRVLCEGGPALLGTLTAAGRVDELCLTVAPLLVAGAGDRIATGPAVLAPQAMTVAHVLEDAGYLYLRYTRH